MDPQLGKMVSDVCLILDESPSVAVALLLHFHWDVRRLVQCFAEDSRAVRRAAGLPCKSSPPFLRMDVCQRAKVPPRRPRVCLAGEGAGGVGGAGAGQEGKEDLEGVRGGEGGAELECRICYCTMTPRDTFALACEHWYCASCWEKQLSIAVADKKLCLACPDASASASSCPLRVPSVMIEFLAGPAVAEAHHLLVLK